MPSLDQAKLSQDLKSALRQSPSWAEYCPERRELAERACCEIASIVTAETFNLANWEQLGSVSAEMFEVMHRNAPLFNQKKDN